MSEGEESGTPTKPQLEAKMPTERPLHPEARKLVPCSTDVLRFTETDVIIREGISEYLSLAAQGRAVLLGAQQEGELAGIMESAAMGQSPVLSETVGRLYRSGQAGRLEKLLTFKSRFGFADLGPWESERHYRFVYFPFSPPEQRTLNQAILKGHRRASRRKEQFRPGWKGHVPGYLIQIGGTFSRQFDFVNSFRELDEQLRADRLPKIEKLLKKIGFPPEKVIALVQDPNMGLNLLAACYLTRTFSRILRKKESCYPAESERIELRGLKNPWLLWLKHAGFMIRSDAAASLRPEESLATYIWRQLKVLGEAEKFEVVGQDVVIGPGETVFVTGENDNGKTIRLKSAIGVFPLRNLEFPVPAKVAYLSETSGVYVISSETRRGFSIGSGLEMELEAIKSVTDQIKPQPWESPLIFLGADDLFQTTDEVTAVALVYTLRDQIFSQCPQAKLLVNTHNTEPIHEAYPKIAGPEAKIRFELIDDKRQAIPYKGLKVYKKLGQVISRGIKEGFVSPEERGPTFTVTDEETWRSIVRAETWLYLLLFDNELGDTVSFIRSLPSVQLFQEFYHFLGKSSGKDFEKWQQLGAALNPSHFQAIAAQSKKSPKLILELAVKTRQLAGAEEKSPLTLLSWSLAELQAKREMWALPRQVAPNQRQITAGLVLALFCRQLEGRKLAGEIKEDRARVVDCPNPALVITQGEVARKINLPIEIFRGKETAVIIRGGNKDGKTEALRTIALQAILQAIENPEALGFDYVLSAERGKPESAEAGGELRQFMKRIGQLKARIREMKDKGRGLIVIDEPGRDTTLSERPETIARVIQELQEESPNIKIVFTTHCGENLEERLEREGISFSNYFIPHRFSHQPYSPVPSEEKPKIDNVKVIESIFGHKFARAFERYREALERNQD